MKRGNDLLCYALAVVTFIVLGVFLWDKQTTFLERKNKCTKMYTLPTEIKACVEGYGYDKSN